MQAPTIGGVQVPRGNGQVIRLSRGASLSDFADKIGANPASLVQVLFHLGEMVTATQSVNDETLQLLGAELNYNVQVVSPEEEDRELLESFDIDFGEDEGGEEDLVARPPVVTTGHSPTTSCMRRHKPSTMSVKPYTAPAWIDSTVFLPMALRGSISSTRRSAAARV